MSYFNAFTAAASHRFEPKTVAEANGYAVLRVVRWFFMAAAVVTMAVVAVGYGSYALGQAMRNDMAMDFETAQSMRPAPLRSFGGLTTEELASASDSLVIEWPSATDAPKFGKAVEELAGAIVATDLSLQSMKESSLKAMTVKQLRKLAMEQGLSARKGGKMLRKSEIVELLKRS